MMLYTKNKDKVYCAKCESPKFNARNNSFDFISGKIDNVKTKFWFSLKNNAGNLYFLLDNQWYRTSIITGDGLDLFTWIYKQRENLFTKKYQN